MRTLLLLPLLPAIACSVDGAVANGELGRMQFALTSDYYLEEHDLSEAAIVTRHEQDFIVSLTGKGEDDAGKKADEIEYTMSPSDGVTVSQSGPDDDGGEDDGDGELANGFSLTVTEPGDYELRAELQGDEFDLIQLSFDTPASLELVIYTRAPWAESFERVTDAEPHAVAEGTQLAWLPVPLGAEGERLLGDLVVEMSADPIESVVPAANVTHVNEDEVQEVFDAASLYFIEPGDVTVTITDEENPSSGSAQFAVGE